MQIGKENLMARFIECLLCDRAECTHRTLVVRRELWKGEPRLLVLLFTELALCPTSGVAPLRFAPGFRGDD